MSNLDFLLNNTAFDLDYIIKMDGDNVVLGYFYGKDGSWVRYEYIFTEDGEFVTCNEVDRSN